MTDVLKLDPKTTAVFAMDFQNGITSRMGDAAGPFLERVAGVLDAARKAGAFVGYVNVAFRPGHPEVPVTHPMFGMIKKNNMMVNGSPEASIDERVKMQEGEPLVTKHRVGPFQGTDLEQILRANNTRHLVLLGISTSGVILSAVRLRGGRGLRRRRRRGRLLRSGRRDPPRAHREGVPAPGPGRDVRGRHLRAEGLILQVCAQSKSSTRQIPPSRFSFTL